MFGLVFGVFGMLLYDGTRVWEAGMLQGYNTITWAVVILQVTPLLQLPMSDIVTPRRSEREHLLVQPFLQLSPACLPPVSRRWAVWSLRRSSSTPTTSSKASPRLSPSSCPHSSPTYGCRTLSPQGRVDRSTSCPPINSSWFH